MMNGDGLRVTLWLSGCSHKCLKCQNPQTWNPGSGIPFDKAAKQELFSELDKGYISGLTLTGGDPLFEKNISGVLDLVAEVNERYNAPQHIVHDKENNHNILIKNANETRLSTPRKSVWVYTGYTWEEIFNCDENDAFIIRRNILKQCDVLVDGRYINEQRDITLKWRGSANQRVIDIQKSLRKNEIVLYCD